MVTVFDSLGEQKNVLNNGKASQYLVAKKKKGIIHQNQKLEQVDSNWYPNLGALRHVIGFVKIQSIIKNK